MTHTASDWVQMVSLAFGIWGTFSAFYFLLVDADRQDFDPRPALHTALESGRFDTALIAVANGRHLAHAAAERARRIPRDTAITAAAILSLTIPTGGNR